MMTRGGRHHCSSRSLQSSKAKVSSLARVLTSSHKIESLNEILGGHLSKLPYASSFPKHLVRGFHLHFGITYRARSRTRSPLSSNGPSPSPCPTHPSRRKAPLIITIIIMITPTPPPPQTPPTTSPTLHIPEQNNTPLQLLPSRDQTVQSSPPQSRTNPITPPTASISTLLPHPCWILPEPPRRSKNPISTTQPLAQTLPSQPPLTRAKDRKRTHTAASQRGEGAML